MLRISISNFYCNNIKCHLRYPIFTKFYSFRRWVDYLPAFSQPAFYWFTLHTRKMKHRLPWYCRQLTAVCFFHTRSKADGDFLVSLNSLPTRFICWNWWNRAISSRTQDQQTKCPSKPGILKTKDVPKSAINWSSVWKIIFHTPEILILHIYYLLISICTTL